MNDQMKKIVQYFPRFFKSVEGEVKWLENYFNVNRRLYELLSFFVVTEAFLYTLNSQDELKGSSSLTNLDRLVFLKFIFWLFILLILTILIYKVSIVFFKRPPKKNRHKGINSNFIIYLAHAGLLSVSFTILGSLFNQIFWSSGSPLDVIYKIMILFIFLYSVVLTMSALISFAFNAGLFSIPKFFGKE